jgi:hypothetical protein
MCFVNADPSVRFRTVDALLQLLQRWAIKTVPVPQGKHGALPCAVDHAVRAADASRDLLRSFGTDRNTWVILKPSS